MKPAEAQPATPATPAKKNRRPGRPGRGAPIGNRNAVGNTGGRANKGRPRPIGAGLQPLKPGESSKSLFVRLAESDREKLEKIATARGEKMSAFAREILLDFIAKNNA